MKKEFNLTEERKKLEIFLLAYKEGNVPLKNILMIIELQDKEFIKLLKEELNIHYGVVIEIGDPRNKIIDKLAGKDLI